MGRRGPPAKPNVINILDGNPSRKPTNAREPEPQRGPTPSPPEILTGIARAEWKRLAKELHRIGLLTTADRTVMCLYCTTYARWVLAEKELQKEGGPDAYKIHTGRDGVERKNPLVSIIQESIGQLRQLMQELGLTPAARAHLRITQAKETDPFDAFTNARKRANKGRPSKPKGKKKTG